MSGAAVIISHSDSGRLYTRQARGQGYIFSPELTFEKIPFDNILKKLGEEKKILALSCSKPTMA